MATGSGAIPPEGWPGGPKILSGSQIPLQVSPKGFSLAFPASFTV